MALHFLLTSSPTMPSFQGAPIFLEKSTFHSSKDKCYTTPYFKESQILLEHQIPKQTLLKKYVSLLRRSMPTV